MRVLVDVSVVPLQLLSLAQHKGWALNPSLTARFEISQSLPVLEIG